MPPPEPRLTGPLHIAPDADTLYDDLASALLRSSLDALTQRRIFHLALSGGSTPEPFYQRLVIDPRYRLIPWEHTHLWQVDERRVPHTDPKSNWKMIRETLADHIPIPPENLHPVPTAAPDPAAEYEQELMQVFNLPDHSAVPRLDFTLLGIGDDGHTASLFPGSDALIESRRWIVNNDGPKVTPPPRITMTYPLLNAAHSLAVLVTGQKKSAILRTVEKQLAASGPNPSHLPITGVKPTDGRLTWYLDAPAAS